MSRMSPDLVVPCHGHPCGSYRGGHNVHQIQARRVGESPWGWRDAVVTAVDGLEVSLSYLVDTGSPVVWHHASLSGCLAVGNPVRLHEQYHVLGTPDGWFSVAVDGGLGAVPGPDDPALWEPETSLGIVDLATGIALPTDHHEENN